MNETPADRSTAERHALITGGGSGIGAAIAEALLRSGCRVTITGRREDVLQQTAIRIGLDPGRYIAMDVTDRTSVEHGVRLAIETAGAVDVLINCAGRAASAPFVRTDEATLDDMLAVNLKGAWNTTQAVLPAMIAQGSGRVINVASTAGLVGYAYVAAYVAAKHAVVGLTRALALEVARHGITVNAVCPGYTETPLLDRALETIAAKTGRATDAARADLARGNPMNRLVQPAEVADAVVWLASPGTAAITGQAIAIAGGEVMTG